jgi:hypothetical protein
MGREAYRSVYGDLTKLKDDSLLKDPAAGTDDDDELFQLLLAMSDWTDHYCNRHFYPRTQTLRLDGSGSPRLLVPDLVSLDTVKEDPNGEGSFEDVWAATDYLLEPYNASPSTHWGVPYSAVRVRSGGRRSCFTAGEQRYEVAGTWGYRQFKETGGATLEGAAAEADGALNVTDGTQFQIGQTLMAGTEQMLVTGIEDNMMTVTRGLNGTSPIGHASGAGVFILRWPPAVERATLIQAARIWTRAADFEPFFVDSELDTDVRLLLEPYRKLAG